MDFYTYVMSSSKQKGMPLAHQQARCARLALVQALFQVNATKEVPAFVREEFLTHRLNSRDDYPVEPNAPLFTTVFDVFAKERDALDTLLQELLPEGSELHKHEPVLIAILRAGSAELMTPHPFAPAPVVIAEYVNLTRGFCGTKQASFTNGLLDQVARRLNRPLTKE